MIGQTISHYCILDKIGMGGMGVVYVAEDQLLKRRVAIKMLTAANHSNHNRFRRRFLREARAIAALNHPHIATIYDYGENANGQPYLVMELVGERTLADLIQGVALPVERAVPLIAAVADALAEAHRHGIVHRDIKPSNIGLNERDEVKVLDFGLAKQMVAEATEPARKAGAPVHATQTCEGVILGTPLYLSPEQALGLAIDARSDLFSLGSLLYQCLTGTPPFAGRSPIEICAKVIHDEPIPPSALNPAVPPELDRITLKAMAKEPGARYQTAAELLADLRQLMRQLETGAGVALVSGEAYGVGEATHSLTNQATRTRDGGGPTVEQVGTTTNPSFFALATSSLSKLSQGRRGWAIFWVLFLISLLLGGRYLLLAPRPVRDLTSALQFQRLTLPGDVKEAIISPDGKYVASIVEASGQRSLRLM